MGRGSEENALGPGAEESELGYLSSNELNVSRIIWIKTVQKQMKNHKNFKNWLLQYNVFEDSDGILRCGGRIGNAPLPYDTRYPVLLSSDAYLSQLIIQEAHITVGHNGCRETLTHIRRMYWIPKCRNFIRKLLKDCRLCRRFEGRPSKYPKPPDLPKERLQQSHAFDVIGIDYAGPVYVKDVYCSSDKMFKAWIGLITCANSRAVYLNLVANCEDVECINLLRRFISRYGAPSLVYSDNGKAFISEDTQNFAASRNISWKFNLEAAPWLSLIHI